MKVKEYIELLKKYNPEAEVWFELQDVGDIDYKAESFDFAAVTEENEDSVTIELIVDF
ncbi:MAG: hypothetical protein ACRC1R_00470 [Cetobacterium sp.]|uniref:hypothetical protein n=1 Tax=Cetobacterium sp. TaxID=2071632 RepID=UPI003F328B4B